MTTNGTRPTRLPAWFWLGVAILAGAQAALVAGVPWAATWLTPIAWTGYALTADGLVHRLTGRSWLSTDRREFPFLAVLSVGVWLLFEAYNFHLRNWYYTGMPADPRVRDFGYLWSFATIMPGVFETGDLLSALTRRRRLFSDSAQPPMDTPLPPMGWTLVGAVLILLPLVFPRHVAAYLFGMLWVGFIFLLEPVSARVGTRSWWRSWQAGDRLPMLGLLGAGLVCGLLWETWNFQAFRHGGAYWVYTIPQPLRVLGWHYGQMPLLGMLGFPPFALELSAFYALLRRLLRLDRFQGG